MAAVDGNGRQGQAAVGTNLVAAVLPLHNGRRTVGVGGVGNGAVVCFFIVAVCGERVRDAGPGGLDQIVADWVVEALENAVVVSLRVERW